MKIHFLSQKDAEKIVPSMNFAIISIIGRDSPLRHLKGWLYRLDLNFDDITYPEAGLKIFSKIDAIAVKRFVKSLPPNITDIYVHCLMGASRSASIAKWLNEYYKTNDFPKFYNIYNRHIYNMLKNT